MAEPDPGAQEDRARSEEDGEHAAADSERVEQLFEQWAHRVGRFLAVGAARAREEAEDILAEAQSLRRGERD